MSVLVEERNLWLDSHSRSSTGYIVRVYPSWTLVSLMGCKRAEGVYMANERMSQRAVYRTRNRARKCAGPSEEKVLVHQSNKSLILLPGLPRGFFFFMHFLPCVSFHPRNVNYDVNFDFIRRKFYPVEQIFPVIEFIFLTYFNCFAL